MKTLEILKAKEIELDKVYPGLVAKTIDLDKTYPGLSVPVVEIKSTKKESK